MVNNIDALRKDTEAIIAVNPVELIFFRIEKQKTEYGSIKEVKTETAAQTVRIAELSHNEQDKLLQEGLLKTHIVNITAMHNADIKAGDKFDFLGNRYEVEFIRKITLGGYADDNAYKMSGKAKEIKESAQ